MMGNSTRKKVYGQGYIGASTGSAGGRFLIYTLQA